jgi:hypothetical protein
MPLNVSQKYIYARERGGLGPIRGGFFYRTRGGGGLEKRSFWGCNFTYYLGNFLEIYIKAPYGVEFGNSVVICACSRV